MKEFNPFLLEDKVILVTEASSGIGQAIAVSISKLQTTAVVCALPKEKFYINLEDVGNTFSSSVLIGLKNA